MKVAIICGARPNFMKIAPLVRALNETHRLEVTQTIAPVEQRLIHTGQHYDYDLSRVFFDELGLPEPDVHLGIGSGSHGEQTARMIIEIERVLIREEPNMVIVVGDVNSTLAGALAAAKLNIPIAHIEAGLRSYDRTMPEEINRKVTDSVSDYLFTPSADASENLRKENIPEERIFFVGNIMVDSLVHSKDKAAGSDILTRLGLLDGRFCLVTLHRPGNVDDPVILRRILQAIESISRLVDVVIPLHPRTRDRLSDYGLLSSLERNEGIRLSQPLGYLDFLKLEMSAQFVMTDSGGVQEETTFLSIPCLTLRENTERPITAIIGTNTLVGSDPGTIVTKATEIISGAPRRGTRPELWDGETAHRIARILSELLVKA